MKAGIPAKAGKLTSLYTVKNVTHFSKIYTTGHFLEPALGICYDTCTGLLCEIPRIITGYEPDYASSIVIVHFKTGQQYG